MMGCYCYYDAKQMTTKKVSYKKIPGIDALSVIYNRI